MKRQRKTPNKIKKGRGTEFYGVSIFIWKCPRAHIHTKIIRKSCTSEFTHGFLMHTYTRIIYIMRTLWVGGEEIKRWLEREKMTITTQPGIKPRTVYFLSVRSTNAATGPSLNPNKSRSHSLLLQLTERQVTYVLNKSTDIPVIQTSRVPQTRVGWRVAK